MIMSDTVSFQVTYDGPALAANEMDVRELAPALVAIADMLEEANKVINGDQATVKVNVRGSFKSGSFSIEFAVIYDWLKNLLSSLNSDGINGALNLIALLGLGGAGTKGLLALIQKLRGRQIKQATNIDESRVELIIEGEEPERIEVDINVVKLFRNLRIRQAVERAVYEPLSREGITTFKAGPNKEHADITIEKSETEYFKSPPTTDQHLSASVAEAHLQIVTVTFKEDNKWRFTRGAGEGTFFALVRDDDFLEKVGRDEIKFSKSDILKVKLRTIAKQTDEGLKTEYEIVEVLEHITSAKQLPLPMKVNKSGVADTSTPPTTTTP
jgi:hypothetical protein